MTVFRVTGAILKMGHGQVRCGKCRKQFDALECMLDEEASPSQEAVTDPPQKVAETSASADPQLPNFNLPTHEEVTMEGSRVEISGTYRVPNDIGGSDADNEDVIRDHVVMERDDDTSPIDESVEQIAHGGTDEHAAEAFDAEPDEDEREHTEDEDDHAISQIIGEPEDEIIGDPRNEPDAEQTPVVPKRWRRPFGQSGKKEHAQIHAELDALAQNGGRRTLRTGVWATVSVFLTIVFLTQMVHHNRDSLVRDPGFGSTVSRIYRALGLSPHPHWDLAAYKWDIYKVGLDPSLGDALRVIGSVANTAPFAQPYPQGKLSLQDRWGAPVGVRAFEPYEYLPSPAAADRLMAPQQRTNIEIVIADPGADAVGYLIHACLEQDRRITCADDFPVRAP